MLLAVLIIEQRFFADALLQRFPWCTTVFPSARISPLSTTISSVFSAVRASPLAKLAIISSMSSAISTCLAAEAARVCQRPAQQLRQFLGRKSRAAQTPCSGRASAELISKEGFSVVAPMRMMLPFSTKGRKASCCALLKRWISSTNRMVCLAQAAVRLRLLHHFLDLLDAAGHGAEINEVCLGPVRR